MRDEPRPSHANLQALDKTAPPLRRRRLQFTVRLLLILPIVLAVILPAWPAISTWIARILFALLLVTFFAIMETIRRLRTEHSFVVLSFLLTVAFISTGIAGAATPPLPRQLADAFAVGSWSFVAAACIGDSLEAGSSKTLTLRLGENGEGSILATRKVRAVSERDVPDSQSDYGVISFHRRRSSGCLLERTGGSR